MKYYKITNKSEQHNGMKYKTGLNVDILPFNPSGDCKPGGIYFAREDILAFVFDYAGSDLSGWIREVEIPDGEQVYENPDEPKKYKAHAVILGKRRKITGKVVAELCAEGANVHADNDCALRYAASNGHAQIVEALIAAGADVHAGDDAALRYAASNGHAQIVEALIAAGADVHAGDDAALRWAANNGHAQIVEALIAAGADVHAWYDYTLRWAANNGYAQIVDALLTAGADVHARDDDALCLAASNGHAQIVEALIAAGANPVAAASVSWVSGELKAKLLAMVTP